MAWSGRTGWRRNRNASGGAIWFGIRSFSSTCCGKDSPGRQPLGQPMSLRIVITTTLNDNLFHAKLVPLLRSRPDLEVVVVSDREGPTYENLRWVWPQGIASKLGRLGGRLPLLVREVFHPRTRLVMAYSLIPHGLFAVALTRLRRVPVFLHYIAGPAELKFAHNTDVSDNRVIARSRNPQRLERLADWTARNADGNFVPGTNTAAFLTGAGYDAAKIAVLHSTIDPERYYPQPGDRDIDILVSAQLRERKRPLFTLDVFREILRRRPGTRFCWLGDGLMHDQFAAASRDMGLSPAMEWTVTNDVAPFYRRAKVFLLCSLNEGLSLASMEAMRCGMVPVVSDTGDMADVAGARGAGKLLPVTATVADYAEAALTFLNDPAQWEKNSRRAFEIIDQEHSFPSAIASWRKILSQFGSIPQEVAKKF